MKNFIDKFFPKKEGRTTNTTVIAADTKIKPITEQNANSDEVLNANQLNNVNQQVNEVATPVNNTNIYTRTIGPTTKSSFFGNPWVPLVPKPNEANLLVVVVEDSSIMIAKKDEVTECISKVLKRDYKYQFIKAYTYSSELKSTPMCSRELYTYNLTFEGISSFYSSVVKVAKEITELLKGQVTNIDNKEYIFKSCKVVFIGSGINECLLCTAVDAMNAVKTMRDNNAQTEFITFCDNGVMEASLLGFREIRLLYEKGNST